MQTAAFDTSNGDDELTQTINAMYVESELTQKAASSNDEGSLNQDTFTQVNHEATSKLQDFTTVTLKQALEMLLHRPDDVGAGSPSLGETPPRNQPRHLFQLEKLKKTETSHASTQLGIKRPKVGYRPWYILSSPSLT